MLASSRTLHSRGLSNRAALFSVGDHTSLLINLHLDVEIYADNDDVAENVERAHAVEDIWVVEGYLLRGLHHDQDDHEVGAIACCQYRISLPARLSVSGGRTFEGSYLR